METHTSQFAITVVMTSSFNAAESSLSIVRTDTKARVEKFIAKEKLFTPPHEQTNYFFFFNFFVLLTFFTLNKWHNKQNQIQIKGIIFFTAIKKKNKRVCTNTYETTVFPLEFRFHGSATQLNAISIFIPHICSEKGT